VISEIYYWGIARSSPSDLQRVLATVLLQTLSVQHVLPVEIGDQRGIAMLDSHDQLAKQMSRSIAGFWSSQQGTASGELSMGPGAAVRCALALGTASKQIGLPLRAGLHTGEMKSGPDIGGYKRCTRQLVYGQSHPARFLFREL